MFLRVTIYSLTFIILGCAEDLDDQITQQDLTKDEPVESNDSFRGNPQVKQDEGELITKKTPQLAEEELESVQAENPKELPETEIISSPEVPLDPVEEEVALVAEPAPVAEKLVEIEVSPPASPKPVEKPVEFPDPSPSPGTSSGESGAGARLHRGMPALNLWYSKEN